MFVHTKLCALLGALALIIPSCDSSNPGATGETRAKPEGARHSAATLQIHASLPSLYGPDSRERSSENFLNNHIALLSSTNVIEKAAAESAIARDIIEDSLWVEAVNGTDLIKLSAYHDDKATAKTIAEAVIAAYSSYRNESELARVKASLKSLDDELTAQNDLVEELRKELTVLIQQYGIPYFDGRSSRRC